MSGLAFASEDALIAVLSSGILPDEVVGGPARWGRSRDGLWVAPSVPVDPQVLGSLRASGVEPFEGSGGQEVCCWPEVVRPRAVDEPASVDEVLFEIPRVDLTSLAGELVRLGCDRQRWAVGEERAWVLAQEPPWFTVLRVLDPRSGGRVLTARRPGVWVEVGWEHPLTSWIRPADGRRVLIAGQGSWDELPDGPWVSLYDQLDVRVPQRPGRLEAREPDRLEVPLRLVDTGRSATCALWVLRGTPDDPDAPLRQLDRLLAHLPEEVVNGLLFGVAPGDVLRIVLRARPSPQGPPPIDLVAERYAPHPELPLLHLPEGGSLEPPLRRDRLRDVLCPEVDEVAWLVREGASFRVERMRAADFHPLSAWVDYLADRDADVLAGWVASATFAFEAWVDLGMEWSERSTTAPRPVERAVEREEVPLEPIPTPRPRPAPSPVRPKPVVVVAPAAVDGVAAVLAAVERGFLDATDPLDAPNRVDAWVQMAELNRRLGRDREASLAWAHAVWGAPEGDRSSLAARWASDELGVLGLDVEDAAQAGRTAPSQPVLQALSACLAAGVVAPDSALVRAFEEGDRDLDIRSLWLARRRLAGDDDLAVARARDHALSRIRSGLSMALDTPAFLRALDAEGVAEVAAHLESQLEHFQRTKRDRHPVECDPARSMVYVRRVFAWGFATLGVQERAKELASSDAPVLRSDPVHDALLGAYDARIAGALEGIPREAPLPAQAAARFDALETYERYSVDRLRQASGILESQSRLDPFRTFELGFSDPRGPEFDGLGGLADPERLRARLSGILDAAGTSPERGRLLDGVVSLLAVLPAADALPLLERAAGLCGSLEPAERSGVLGSMLLVAGQLGRVDRVRELSGRLVDALQELPIEELSAQSDGLVKSLRSLRRVGLTDEASALMAQVASRAEGADLDRLVVRVVVAGGQAGLGRADLALPVVDQGLRRMGQDFRAPLGRLRLARAIGLAVANAPRSAALHRLTALAGHLPVITDSYSTNSHFCLSLVDFAESVVLGYTDGSLARGDTGRRWIDEAEFLVRRQIHR